MSIDPEKRDEIKGEIMAEGVPVGKPPSEVQIAPVGNYAQREPVFTTASVVGLITGIVSYAVAKGWFDAADEAFFIAMAPVIAGVVIGLVGRLFATPTKKANVAIDVAYESNPAIEARPTL